MATCKGCVHVEACEFISQRQEKFMNDFFDEQGREISVKFGLPDAEKCPYFKDRSRFVELPCKVGDTVYWDVLGKPVEDKITNITIYDNVIRVFLKKGISFDIEDIGRMIFLSREEAEQALKERENDA